MKEQFLHFIWQFQYFDKTTLKTTSGDDLTILRQGFSNKNSGPDFSECRIKINNLEWIGNIEIHYKSSEWNAHKHHEDKAYDNVILHVVWSDDKPVSRTDQSLIPTLELKQRIDPNLIQKYTNFIKSEGEIICASFFKEVPDVIKRSMLDKALMERLELKSSKIADVLKSNGNNWEETTYQLLASNFGFKLNEFPFTRLSRVIPFKIISKHAKNLMQLESLLFGMAGLLDQNFQEEYPNMLKNEYKYLTHKYNLNGNQLMKSDWKFSKIRPANFPTIRIAQFANFIHYNFPIFASFLSIENAYSIFSKTEESTTSYWSDHYLLDKKTSIHSARLGKSSMWNLMVNTVVPLLICYAQQKDDLSLKEKALNILETVPAETNHITDRWEKTGWKFRTAFDSQGAIELYNSYCQKKTCMRCSIGIAILQRRDLNQG